MDSMDVVGLLAGFAFVGVGVFRLVKRYYLKKRCTAQVVGTVIETTSTRGIHEDDSWGTRTHFVKFGYSVEGAEYEKRHIISGSQYNALDSGQEITVCYDPSDPKRCYALEIKHRIILTTIYLVSGALLLLAFLPR
ncbi:MAG: DUF3592 domain-containing protein [Oscillospiraceae bacterium]|nr:DUF3592 domain-containing protein [Oscillospiraceae bacterium]